MPYIPKERRRAVDAQLGELCKALDAIDASEGDLNYVVSTLVNAWLPVAPRYADYNAAVGILECAKLELYRTAIGPYESAAQVQHGPLKRHPIASREIAPAAPWTDA